MVFIIESTLSKLRGQVFHSTNRFLLAYSERLPTLNQFQNICIFLFLSVTISHHLIDCVGTNRHLRYHIHLLMQFTGCLNLSIHSLSIKVALSVLFIITYSYKIKCVYKKNEFHKCEIQFSLICNYFSSNCKWIYGQLQLLVFIW